MEFTLEYSIKKGYCIFMKIKLDFCGFWSSFNKQDNLFVRMLSKHFEIEITDNPDFVICSNRGKPFEYMRYNCPRIMFMGENMSPDFTVFDYVIGFDFLEFGDRYFRLPFAYYSDDALPWIPEQLTEDDAWKILKGKRYFANFIYGHESSLRMRENIFAKLNTYKDVVSPGSYMNNTEKSTKKLKRCSWKVKNEYLKFSKFTIAGDSIQYPGFVTEKIVQPFQWHSIPIYWGSPRIDEDFNTDAFVWCKESNDLDRMLEEVQYLDQHDDAYIHMLMQCPLKHPMFLKDKYEELEIFLVNIFEQNPEDAYRRVRYFAAEQHERYLKEYAKIYEKIPKVIDKIKNCYKRIK